MWQGYKNFDHHFTISQLNEFFDEVDSNDLTLIKMKKGVEYFNVPCSFDIETSSFKNDQDQKFACMYLWGANINGSSIIGRTWEDFQTFLLEVHNHYNLDSESRIMIFYVHNLGYEFQFMSKRILWEPGKVFSIKERRPVYALSQLGIEFRCSYFLSNYSLAYIGSELLKKYPVTKKVGLLDYQRVRNHLTPLTNDEIRYQLDDVRVVVSYIQEKIENDGNILKIPLTNTGYVRRYCRDYCLKKASGKINFNYRVLMKNLQIQTEKEYKQLKSAFMGGFTHANPHYSGKILNNVGSADLTSDYPYQMVGDYFPMTGGAFLGEINDLKLFNKLLKKYCCLFTITLYGITPKVTYDNYISISHCEKLSDDYVSQNGRLVTADYAQMTITELDWDIIDKTYYWDEIEIYNFRVYGRGYLPRELVLSILELYKNKTSLKGVDDKVIEYMVSKNMINAAYGMAVTNIVRDEIIFTEDYEWKKEAADAAEQLMDYNKKFNRFLSYGWGVWVTAHARHCLWEAIMEFGDDYVYADTDSIKGLNFDKHKAFFANYNLNVKLKLAAMCKAQNIPFSMCAPKTIEGKTKVIGLWDIEHPYELFKTIGAKRYIYKYADTVGKDGLVDYGEFSMTVAGVNKSSVIPFMLYRFSDERYHTDKWLEIFRKAYDTNPDKKNERKEAMKIVKEEAASGRLDYFKVMMYFRQNLYIPPDHTGKMTLTYIDHPNTFMCTDYLGNTTQEHEETSIYMEKASFSFSITQEYLAYLFDIQDASI